MDQFASKVAPYLPMGTFFAFQTVTQLILPTNGTLLPSPLDMLRNSTTAHMTYFADGSLADQLVSVNISRLLAQADERSSRDAVCNSLEFVMSVAWLALMCVVCFGLAFTDTAIDEDGGGVPIFVLPRGYWMPPGSKMMTPEYHVKFRPGGSGAWCWVDVCHCLLSTITLLTMALLTPPVYTCFFAHYYVPSVVTRAVPAIMVTIATAVFGFFKRSRDGSGYDLSPQARDSDDLFTYLSSGSNIIAEAKLKVMLKMAEKRVWAAEEKAEGLVHKEEAHKEVKAAEGKVRGAAEEAHEAAEAVGRLEAAVAGLEAAVDRHASEHEGLQLAMSAGLQVPRQSSLAELPYDELKPGGSSGTTPDAALAAVEAAPTPRREQARQVEAARRKRDAAQRQLQRVQHDWLGSRSGSRRGSGNWPGRSVGRTVRNLRWSSPMQMPS